jgi:hypothetical protein
LLLLIQSQYLPQSVHITFTHFWMRGSLDRCHGMCVARRRRAGSGWTTAWKSRRSSPARSPSRKVRDGEELPYRCLPLSLRFMCLCCFCLESRAVHTGFALRLSCPIERDELVVVVPVRRWSSDTSPGTSTRARWWSSALDPTMAWADVSSERIAWGAANTTLLAPIP